MVTEADAEADPETGGEESDAAYQQQEVATGPSTSAGVFVMEDELGGALAFAFGIHDALQGEEMVLQSNKSTVSQSVKG